MAFASVAGLSLMAFASVAGLSLMALVVFVVVASASSILAAWWSWVGPRSGLDRCWLVVVVAWSRVSVRRRRLPSDWSARRAAVLRRDGGRCQWKVDSVSVCGAPATDVDHIVPGDDDSFGNLRALCREHHAWKSAREGHVALARMRREVAGRFRRSEPHPGLRGGGVVGS